MLITETAPLTAPYTLQFVHLAAHNSLFVRLSTIVTNGIENGHTHGWIFKTIYTRVRCIRCIYYTAHTHMHTHMHLRLYTVDVLWKT